MGGMIGGGGGGSIDEIDIDTSFVDEAKNESLTFLAQSLAEGLPYAEKFFNKAFNQRIAFHDQAVADFDRIFALSEPYRQQGFAAFDKLTDMYGMPRLEGGSYALSKALSQDAQNRGIKQQTIRASQQFVNELGIKDPVLAKNLNYLASSGIGGQSLMNAIEGMRGYDTVPRDQPYSNLTTKPSMEGGEVQDSWKQAGLTSQQWPGTQEGTRNSTYDPYSTYMQQTAPLQGQINPLTTQQSSLLQALKSGQLQNQPINRM